MISDMASGVLQGRIDRSSADESRVVEDVAGQQLAEPLYDHSLAAIDQVREQLEGVIVEGEPY